MGMGCGGGGGGGGVSITILSYQAQCSVTEILLGVQYPQGNLCCNWDIKEQAEQNR